MKRHRRPAWQRGAIVLVPLALLGVRMFDQPGPAAAAPGLPTVTVAAPLVRQVSEWDEHVRQFAPSRMVPDIF